ncbi:MAG: DUF485 domain-containing protein [Planctomycetota bacterium]
MSAPLSDPSASNRRLGLRLFVLYLFFYLGFVLLSAFGANWMERPVLAGLNLAIVYGAGLIVAALVLSLLYGAMCKSEVPPKSDASSSEVPR